MDCMYDPWPDSDQEGWYGPGSVVSGPMVPWSPPRPRCGIYPPWPGADGGHVLHPANISGYLLCVGMESQKVTESCCARLFQVSEVTHQWILCVLMCQWSVLWWNLGNVLLRSGEQCTAGCLVPPSSLLHTELDILLTSLICFLSTLHLHPGGTERGGVYGGWLHQF